MKTDAPYIEHISEAIAKIKSYTVNCSYDEFLEDSMRHDAVIRQLEIIGEAVAQLSASFKEKHPRIPWKAVVGMRNKLIHGYFGVDLEAVWKTVHHDIPKLEQIIQGELS